LSTPLQLNSSQCPNCLHDLALGVVACPECHTLVYGPQLEALAKEAKSFESAGQFSHAREAWNSSLAMLPHDSKQAEWVRDHVRSMELTQAQNRQTQAPKSPAWAKRLGPLAPIAVLLAKSKGLLLALFKLKFLFSFFSFLAIYVAIFGWKFGVGFAVSILIHEMGHYVDIKRRGLPAEMPVFLPGLGAYVKWQKLGVTRRQISQISLAGPLAGWIAAAVCVLLYAHTHDPLWAALARMGAGLNLLNLIPVWILDGGKAIGALGAVERAALLAIALGLWLYTGEGIFFLVSAGCVWRLFTKDKPTESDWGTWLYFAALLAALAAVMHAMPGTIAHRPGP
jgi:Zn-dependent protease